jgi:hypothetical protein
MSTAEATDMNCYSHLHLHLDKVYVTTLAREGKAICQNRTAKLRGFQLEKFRRAWLEAHPVEATQMLVDKDGKPMHTQDGRLKALCAICTQQLQRYIDSRSNPARIVPLETVP